MAYNPNCIAMRKDIEVNINTGDVKLISEDKPQFMSFRWLDSVPEGELQEYLYGEVTLPHSQSDKQLFVSDVCVKIPYTPIASHIKIRFEKGSEGYVVNPTDHSQWFDVYSTINGAELSHITAPELILIDDCHYSLRFEHTVKTDGAVSKVELSGKLLVYTAYNKDFNIIKADHQNSNLLIKCNPTNNYRYPTSGVGVVRWINGDIGSSNLADILQQEFNNDGAVIHNASYDEKTGSLVIDANYDDLD